MKSATWYEPNGKPVSTWPVARIVARVKVIVNWFDPGVNAVMAFVGRVTMFVTGPCALVPGNCIEAEFGTPLIV